MSIDPPLRQAHSPEKEFKDNVIIIGAGYAGISAALELHRRRVPFKVLEAQNRFGGRVRSYDTGFGFHVELGAQWVGPGQKKLLGWVEEVYGSSGLSKTNQTGKPVYWFNGKIETKEHKARLEWLLNSFSKKFGFPDDKITSKEKKWDSRSVEDLLDYLTEKLRIFPSAKSEIAKIKRGIEIGFAMDPDKMSLLSGMYNINGAGGLSGLTDVGGGAQESFLPAGFQNLLEKIAEPFRGNIYLDEQVIAIDQQDPEQVIVRTTQKELKAKRVIVTIPPILLFPREAEPKIERGIDFTPLLSRERQDLISRLSLGAPIKCSVIFETPFWRERGYSGQVLTDRFPVAGAYDCSPSDQQLGVLTIFIKEREKNEFVSLDKEAKQYIIKNEISNLFGDPVPGIIDLIDHVWDETTEKWAAGGYACGFPPGVYSKHKNLLRKPEGRIHWAGTETADEWQGFMEGAILSGKRAAGEVMDVIS